MIKLGIVSWETKGGTNSGITFDDTANSNVGHCTVDDQPGVICPLNKVTSAPYSATAECDTRCS